MTGVDSLCSSIPTPCPPTLCPVPGEADLFNPCPLAIDRAWPLTETHGARGEENGVCIPGFF